MPRSSKRPVDINDAAKLITYIMQASAKCDVLWVDLQTLVGRYQAMRKYVTAAKAATYALAEKLQAVTPPVEPVGDRVRKTRPPKRKRPTRAKRKDRPVTKGLA